MHLISDQIEKAAKSQYQFSRTITSKMRSTCCKIESSVIGGSAVLPTRSCIDNMMSNNSSLVTTPSPFTSYKLKAHSILLSTSPCINDERQVTRSCSSSKNLDCTRSSFVSLTVTERQSGRKLHVTDNMQYAVTASVTKLSLMAAFQWHGVGINSTRFLAASSYVITLTAIHFKD